MPSLLLLAPLVLCKTPSLAPASIASLAQIDAVRIARASDDLLRRAKTVQGTYTVVGNDNTASVVHFAMDRPDSVEIRSPGKVEIYTGRYHYLATEKGTTYQRREGELYGRPYVPGLTAFFNPDAPALKGVTLPKFGPAETVDVDGRVFVRRMTSDGASVDIDPTTKLPARWSWTVGDKTVTAAFQDLRLGDPIPAEAFDVTAVTGGRTLVPTPEELALPAVGTSAASITGTTINGKAFDLGTVTPSRRATILVFFDPQTQSSARGIVGLGLLAQERTMRDVAVVGVSNNPSDRTSRDFLRNCKYRPTTVGATGAAEAIGAYAVKVYPTYFVLDREGMIVERMIGFDKAAIDAAVSNLK